MLEFIRIIIIILCMLQSMGGEPKHDTPPTKVAADYIVYTIEETVKPTPEPISIPASTPEPTPPSIYTLLPADEIQLLFGVVEAEIGCGNFNQKCNVVSVIFNRMKYVNSTSLYSVLIPDQFTTIANGMYLQYPISETTIQACEYIFNNGNYLDTTQGALYFETLNKNNHSKYASFIFDDGLHRFYK